MTTDQYPNCSYPFSALVSRLILFKSKSGPGG